MASRSWACQVEDFARSDGDSFATPAAAPPVAAPSRPVSIRARALRGAITRWEAANGAATSPMVAGGAGSLPARTPAISGRPPARRAGSRWGLGAAPFARLAGVSSPAVASVEGFRVSAGSFRIGTISGLASVAACGIETRAGAPMRLLGDLSSGANSPVYQRLATVTATSTDAAQAQRKRATLARPGTCRLAGSSSSLKRSSAAICSWQRAQSAK